MTERTYGYDHTKQCPNNPIFEDGEVVSAQDWLGNRFAVGDQVMYCIGAARGQMMAIGQVVKICAEERRGGRSREAGPDEEPTRVITCWDGDVLRLIDLDETYHQITVQVLTRKTSGHWNNEARSKPAWVNAMNITAMPAGDG